MRSLPHWSCRLLPALCFLCVTGCGDSGNSGSPPQNHAAAPVAPDDPAAVAALETAGCQLTKDGSGHVTEIAVSSDSEMTDTLAHLSGIPNTTAARFGGPGLTDAGLKNLSALKKLRRLDLTDCSAVGDETLKVVGELKDLEALILRRVGFTDAGLAAVSGLPRLRALDLRNSNLTDAGLDHVTGIRTLVDIQLEKANITDAGVEKLKGLPLKSLNLNYTAVTDGAMPTIGTLTTLESLQMEASRLTDAGMPQLAKLTKLKRFGCRLADVTGAGIKNLSGLTDLTRLELRETSLDDEGLEVISGLPKLEFLDISECKLVTGEGIKKLGRLTGLTYLELREIKRVRDDNFAELGTLTNLVELNVEATRITSEAVPTLLKFQKLKSLSIAGSQIDDGGMVKLSQLPSLATLNLRNCDPMPETLAALRAAKSDLKIID